MNWLDISTYIGNNIGDFIGDLVLGGLIACLFVGIGTAVYLDCNNFEKDKDRYVVIRNLSLTIFLSFIFSLSAFIPTHDKILAVKLSKIKNEIVTKDNVDKTKEDLERILKKLECKYLECKENNE